MAPYPRENDEGLEKSPVGDRRAGDDERGTESVSDPSAVGDDAGASAFRDHLEKARRLVALELDLAETRRRLAEDNLKITEAQLELAEREIEELKAENGRLRGEIADLRIG
jgi:hypothetical protein